MPGRLKARDPSGQGRPKGREHVYGLPPEVSTGVSPQTSLTGPWIPEDLVKVRRVWGSACLTISLVTLSLHIQGPRCAWQGLGLEAGNKKRLEPLTALGSHRWEQSRRDCGELGRACDSFSASLRNSSVAALLIFPNNLYFYRRALYRCWQRCSSFQKHPWSE